MKSVTTRQSSSAALHLWGQARYGVRPNPESESNTQRAAASGCNHHNVSAEVAVALIFSFI